MKTQVYLGWGAIWRSENRVDGKREHPLMGPSGLPWIFKSRREAQNYIDMTYGYIRRRPDLRAEPHGWKIPVARKIKVRVELV